MTEREAAIRTLTERYKAYSVYRGFALDTETEEYITLFCEGDGHVGLYGSSGISRIQIANKEKDVLDYIAALIPRGCFWLSKKDNTWRLDYHGRYCVPLLEIFSRHVVSERFLDRLNTVLTFCGLPCTSQHPLTLSGFVGFWDAEGTSANAPFLSVVQSDDEMPGIIRGALGGSVYVGDNNVGKKYTWTLCGDSARQLATTIIERSHIPSKVERLRRNFEGLSYHWENRERVLAYHKKRYAEEKAFREYVKTHSV